MNITNRKKDKKIIVSVFAHHSSPSEYILLAAKQRIRLIN